MEFSILDEFGIIEEACKVNRKVVCFPVAEISVNQQFAAKLFQIPEGLL